MSERIIPGHYELLSAVLTTFAGKSIEISGNFIPKFTIEESINNDSVRGSATVYDNIGILENLPIRGEETLVLQVEDALKEKITYEMAIYKVTDVAINKTNDGLIYTIHFISKKSFDAAFRKIIAPYDTKISSIVEDIFKKYYGEAGKGLLLEDTIGLFRCIIPNYTPMQTMNFLASRAFSSTSGSSSFRFFETADDYYFVSDEYLIDRFVSNPDTIKEFTYSDAVNKSGEDFLGEMRNLKEIRNPDRGNTILDLLSGSYRSNVIEVDLIKRSVTLPRKSKKHEYIYENEKSKYISVAGKGRAENVHTPEFISQYFTGENERRYLVVRDYADNGNLQLRGEQYLPQIVTNRTAYRYHLNNTTVFATANGRLDIHAGDVVNIKAPEFNSAQQKDLNPQLSGNYLVDSVTHIFDKDVHETAMKLLKYDWSTEE